MRVFNPTQPIHRSNHCVRGVRLIEREYSSSGKIPSSDDVEIISHRLPTCPMMLMVLLLVLLLLLLLVVVLVCDIGDDMEAPVSIISHCLPACPLVLAEGNIDQGCPLLALRVASNLHLNSLPTLLAFFRINTVNKCRIFNSERMVVKNANQRQSVQQSGGVQLACLAHRDTALPLLGHRGDTVGTPA